MSALAPRPRPGEPRRRTEMPSITSRPPREPDAAGHHRDVPTPPGELGRMEAGLGGGSAQRGHVVRDDEHHRRPSCATRPARRRGAHGTHRSAGQQRGSGSPATPPVGCARWVAMALKATVRPSGWGAPPWSSNDRPRSKNGAWRSGGSEEGPCRACRRFPAAWKVGVRSSPGLAAAWVGRRPISSPMKGPRWRWSTSSPSG